MTFLLVAGLAACASSKTVYTNDNDPEHNNVVLTALYAGMLGTTWNSIEDEMRTYDQGLTRFYCVVTQDYSSEIPAVKFEEVIQSCFDVSTEFLHSIDEYVKNENVYTVSVDTLYYVQNTGRHSDYLEIGASYNEGNEIKIPYRIIWGDMAASGDGSDTAFAGIISLEANGDYYRINGVEITEDYSNKYR